MLSSCSAMQATMVQIQGESKLWKLKKHCVIGKGSFGMAILFEDMETNDFVVVKDMNLQCVKKASDVEALHNEIQILKKTSAHPNIVHYLDSSFDGKFSMQIIMEYCDGGDLGQRIEDAERKGQHLAEDEVISITTQILMGLHHLHHDHRILHRDLKPQNIFLRKDGVAKIGDFGVSTILSQNVEFAKTFCGSPYYLAPELCEEKRYNGKADLWSCGVMLYEMMALRRPFDGRNLVTLIMQITKAEYPPLSDELKYSAQLKDLSYSFLQLLPDHRPVLKRVLRSSLVMASWPVLPGYCKSNAFYLSHFNRSAVSPISSGTKGRAQESSQRQQSDEASKNLLSELEMWAMKDKETLLMAETAAGLKPKREVVDVGMLDGTQKREMASTMAPHAVSSAAPLTLSESKDEEYWNEYYDDDAFDDDDVVVECEPSCVPLAERTFRFS